MSSPFNNFEGDCFQSHLIVDDVFDRDGLLEAQNLENTSINQSSLYQRIQRCLYVCGACGEKVMEPNLSEHHGIMHSEVPFIMDMYELFEIDERIQCLACNVEILENNLTRHMALYHPEILLDSANGNEREQSIEAPQSEEAQTNRFEYPPTEQFICNESRYYSCQLCDAYGIKEENISRHKLRVHSTVSEDIRNIFILTKIIKKITCDICHKQLKFNRIEEHRLMCHPDKYGPGKTNSEVPEGFCQVLVSNEEVKRLKNIQCIYEDKGHLFLKDSK